MASPPRHSLHRDKAKAGTRLPLPRHMTRPEWPGFTDCWHVFQAAWRKSWTLGAEERKEAAPHPQASLGFTESPHTSASVDYPWEAICSQGPRDLPL